MEKTIQCINFKRPDGRKEEVTIRNIYPEDADYINKNNIKVSLEDLGTDYCVWFDDGKIIEDEPDEIIVLSQGKNCQETIKEGVRLLKERNVTITN